MPILQLQQLSKRYRDRSDFAVKSVSLDLAQGDILALVGESGSGKTTLLRMIAGLEHPNAGTITLSGNEIAADQKSVPPNKRNIGLVFQDYALFPHLNLFENISFGLFGQSVSEKERIVTEMLTLTGLDEDMRKYPHELSGGQQQRVALARALAPKPDILLLDEPFSNLDAILREQVREDVKRIIKATGITAILVTHDTKDALCTADQVAVMYKGELLQVGDPTTIYYNPTANYVATLFGKFNLLPGQWMGDRLATPYGDIGNCSSDGLDDEGGVQVFFRPEQVEIVNGIRTDSSLLGVVKSCQFQGERWHILLNPEEADGPPIHIHTYGKSPWRYEEGDTVHFLLTGFGVWDPD